MLFFRLVLWIVGSRNSLSVLIRFSTSKTRGIGIAGENSILFDMVVGVARGFDIDVYCKIGGGGFLSIVDVHHLEGPCDGLGDIIRLIRRHGKTSKIILYTTYKAIMGSHIPSRLYKVVLYHTSL